MVWVCYSGSFTPIRKKLILKVQNKIKAKFRCSDFTASTLVATGTLPLPQEPQGVVGVVACYAGVGGVEEGALP